MILGILRPANASFSKMLTPSIDIKAMIATSLTNEVSRIISSYWDIATKNNMNIFLTAFNLVWSATII